MIDHQEMRSERHVTTPTLPAGKESGAGVFVCRLCKQAKPEQAFYLRKDSGKHRSECKSCITEDRKLKYPTAKSEIRRRQRAHKIKHPLRKLLWSAKSTAMRKGLAFNLTEADLSIPEFCPYLGVRLTNSHGQGFVESNISVDRIDSSKGYIKGNVQVISRKANSMKNSASREELLAFARNILRLCSQ